MSKDAAASLSDHGLCAGDAFCGFDLGQNRIQLVPPRLLQGLLGLKGKGGFEDTTELGPMLNLLGG